MQGIQFFEGATSSGAQDGLHKRIQSRLTLQPYRLCPWPAWVQCSPHSTLKSSASRWDPRAHRRLMRRDMKVYVMPFDGKLERFFINL